LINKKQTNAYRLVIWADYLPNKQLYVVEPMMASISAFVPQIHIMLFLTKKNNKK